MNVLITGAYGFVGTNLSAHLAGRGFELWALDVSATAGNRTSANGSSEIAKSNGIATANRQPPTAPQYSRSYDWGQLEEIPWGEVDAVIHLAGKAHDTRNVSDPQSYFDINVGLTKRIVEALVCQGAKATDATKKIILFSSVKAVADRVEGVLTEETAPDPKTPYGQSKLEAEREVLKFCSSKVLDTGETTANDANENNIRTYILRPCMIHGPGNKGNLTLLYGMVRRGIPWPLGGFENRRSFASIGNVCAVLESLLKGDVPSGIYQVADDDALSTNELVMLMSEVMGRRARVWRLSAGLMRAAARLGDVLRLPLNSERLKKLTESYIVSNGKLKAALGWEKMPVGAREGMRKTLESFGQKAVGNRMR